MQQPHPGDQLGELIALLHLDATHALKASAHCVTEALIGRGDHSVETEGGTQHSGGVIGRACVDAHCAIRGASLAGQGAHHRRQPGASVVGDNNRSDVMVPARQQRLGLGFVVEGEPFGGLLRRDLIIGLTRPDEIKLAHNRLIGGICPGQQLLGLDQQGRSRRPPFVFGGVGAERGVFGISETLFIRTLPRTPQ